MRILAVGIATIDIINYVEDYPEEDSEVRAQGQRVARGGNATNTLVVLSQLGHRCSWAGVIANEPDSRHILDDLAEYGVDTHYAVNCVGGKSPTSYVTLSHMGGSRTIVHYRKLPEYSDWDFQRVNRSEFDWIHFEGRNVSELEKMMGRMKRPQERCSLEVEKPRPGIERVFSLADVLLFSGVYARHRGYDNGADFLADIRAELGENSAGMSCTWGDRGAWAMDPGGRVTYSPAYSPREVVDTLGAGDVFNAAVIDGVSRGTPLQDLLPAACRLAGEKCGRIGLKVGVR